MASAIDSSAPRTWTIADHSVGGHRLAYVTHLARYLLERHHEVRLRLPAGATDTQEFSAHLARIVRAYGDRCEIAEVSPINLRRYSFDDWEAWLTDVMSDGDRNAGLLVPMADWALPHLTRFLRSNDRRRIAVVLMPFTLRQYYAEFRGKSFLSRWKNNERCIRELRTQHLFTGISVVRSASYTGTVRSTLAYRQTTPFRDLVTIDYDSDKDTRPAAPVNESACLLVGDISRRKDFSSSARHCRSWPYRRRSSSSSSPSAFTSSTSTAADHSSHSSHSSPRSRPVSSCWAS